MSQPTPLIHDTNEFIDIFHYIFQFMEIRDIYPLRNVSLFFLRLIEQLKKYYIRPVYEIGVVSCHQDQLQSFVRQILQSKSGLIPSMTDEDRQAMQREVFIELNDGDRLVDIRSNDSTSIQIFERIEKQLIFKQDRFRVIFFPMLCKSEATLAVDELNRLEGFIFLKQETLDAYKQMPTGCQFCATFLNDGFTFEMQEPILVTTGNATLKTNESLAVKKRDQDIISLIKMPVKSFGYFRMEKGANSEQVQKTLLDCTMYIMQHSNRCLQLDHSQYSNRISEQDTKNNSTMKLIEILTYIATSKMKHPQLVEFVTKLFQNRYSYYNLLMTNDTKYFTKRICFFHLPYNLQFKLLKEFYGALMHSHGSLLINKGKCQVSHVTLEPGQDCLEVYFLQECAEQVPGRYSYVYNIVMKPYATRVRFYLSSEKVEFISQRATSVELKEWGQHPTKSSNVCLLA
ncbi:hypothetical protein C9374_003678 [Naegleria lovaniensis]|uniref:Uncharacterized protein n=1 Tax=Naegleria lovaniensis TaxID=51637 RepID=A0AA88H0C0_NAELO|nr:uncharacterized protein C9374_003678 [Naegleria lovaniensis]KAG2393914.1 hypothetical protein C9374_003678 [Naegleria lovaniensis]